MKPGAFAVMVAAFVVYLIATDRAARWWKLATVSSPNSKPDTSARPGFDPLETMGDQARPDLDSLLGKYRAILDSFDTFGRVPM